MLFEAMNCSIILMQDGQTSFDVASLQGNMDVCQELTAGTTALMN